MSLQNKLKRFQSHLTQEKQQVRSEEHDAGKKEEIKQKKDLISRRASVPYVQEWKRMETVPVWFEDEYCLVREVHYPLYTKHGNYTFSQLKDVVQGWNRLQMEHPLSTYEQGREKQADQLLFFDTETTGLSSGTGNAIFLLGCAYVRKETMVVKQFLLPHPSAEVAFYHTFLTDVGDLKNLVTYNGKAFDWPQVKTRHTLIRDEVPRLPPFGHYDLLHAARRLWKDELSSCRLPVVEAEKLGFERQDDVAGHLAPMLYFDFLQEKDPRIIQGVLQHNEWDVLSLVSLYIHLGRKLQCAAQAPCDFQTESLSEREMFEMGRWFEKTKQTQAAQSCYQDVMDQSASSTFLSMLSRHRLAHLYKKNKNVEQAIHLWETLRVEQPPFQMEVLIELAKLYEHHVHDIPQALDCTNEAKQYVQTQPSVSGPHQNFKQHAVLKRWAAEIEHRWQRLMKKA